MLRFIVGVCAFLVPVAAGAQEKQPVIEEAVLRKAVTKALPVIQKSQQVFYKKNESCVSCHHHNLPALLFPMARDRGIGFDGAVAEEAAGKTFSHLKDLDAIVQGYNFIDEIDDAWKLVAAHAAGVPPSPATSARAQFLASAQRPDGDRNEERPDPDDEAKHQRPSS